MTILVTGANGQVGHELVTQGGGDLVGLGRNELDITQGAEISAVLERVQPALVINAAAYTAVDQAEQESVSAFSINRDGPCYLARACAAQGIPLIHLSTDYVFDGRQPTPYREQDPVAPLGVYGRSKWEGEEAVRQEQPRHLILRVSWVFGAHGKNFVKTMLRLGREHNELRVVADQHGCPTHAGAIAATLLKLAERIKTGESLPWGTYHYTGQPATTWHGFAETIFAEAAALGLLEREPIVRAITTAEYPTRVARPANSVLDCARIGRILGIHNKHWLLGLRKTLKIWNA